MTVFTMVGRLSPIQERCLASVVRFHRPSITRLVLISDGEGIGGQDGPTLRAIAGESGCKIERVTLMSTYSRANLMNRKLFDLVEHVTNHPTEDGRLRYIDTDIVASGPFTLFDTPPCEWRFCLDAQTGYGGCAWWRSPIVSRLNAGCYDIIPSQSLLAEIRGILSNLSSCEHGLLEQTTWAHIAARRLTEGAVVNLWNIALPASDRGRLHSITGGVHVISPREAVQLLRHSGLVHFFWHHKTALSVELLDEVLDGKHAPTLPICVPLSTATLLSPLRRLVTAGATRWVLRTREWRGRIRRQVHSEL